MTLPSIVSWRRTRFGQDVRVALLFYRSLALWPLGYPEGALAEADRAISDAREIGPSCQSDTLPALTALTSLSQIHCGSYAVATAQLDEVITLANETGLLRCFLEGGRNAGPRLPVCHSRQSFGRRTHDHFWTERMACHGNATVWMPTSLSYLTKAYAELGQFDEASRCISEAIVAVQTTNREES